MISLPKSLIIFIKFIPYKNVRIDRHKRWHGIRISKCYNQTFSPPIVLIVNKNKFM